MMIKNEAGLVVGFVVDKPTDPDVGEILRGRFRGRDVRRGCFIRGCNDAYGGWSIFEKEGKLVGIASCHVHSSCREAARDGADLMVEDLGYKRDEAEYLDEIVRKHSLVPIPGIHEGE
jgi:hypothetical protein